VQVVLCLLVGGQLALLKALPYASCSLERVDGCYDRPDPNFRIGSVEWDVRYYSQAAELEPLRQYFREACPGNEAGLEAAVRISVDFYKRFPMGAPSVDFFSTRFDLLNAFAAHLREREPGHCVSRSGLLAAVLLSAGRPARVVQIFSPRRRGHNVVEVWDGKDGWVIVDPTFMTRFRPRPGEAVASRAADPISHQSEPEVFSDRGLPLPDPPAYYFDDQDGLLRGPRVYPEPWLYLRTGPRFATFPFRGKFLVPGNPLWCFGPVQTLLQGGILVCAGLLVLTVFLQMTRLLRGWISRRKQVPAGAAFLGGPAQREAAPPREEGLSERGSEQRGQRVMRKVEPDQ
jgi:hypothetical protein